MTNFLRMTVSLAVLAVATSAAAATRYTVTVVGGPNSGGNAINRHGTVVGGQAGLPLYAPADAPSFQIAAPEGSFFTGINDTGVATVRINSDTSSGRYSPSDGLQIAPTPPGAARYVFKGINNSGTAVGWAEFASIGRRAIVAAPGQQAASLGSLAEGQSGEGRPSEGYAINDAGVTVGYAIDANGDPVAFIHTPGEGMTALRRGFGSAINNAGQVVVIENVLDQNFNATGHSYLYTPGSGFTEIALGSGGTYGNAINSHGIVVGNYAGMNGFTSFVYDGHSSMDLSGLVDNLAPGDTISHAAAINARGQITGSGIFGGVTHAFRLDPIVAGVPDPATWALLITGFGLTGTAMRRRGARAVAA